MLRSRDKYLFPGVVPTGPWAECGGDIFFASTYWSGRRCSGAAIAGCLIGGGSATWFFDEGPGQRAPDVIQRVALLVALSGGRAIAVVSRTALPFRRAFALDPGAYFGRNLDTPNAGAWVRALIESSEPRAVATSDGEVLVVITSDGKALASSLSGSGAPVAVRSGVRDVCSAARTPDGGMRVLLCTSAGPACLLFTSRFELVGAVEFSGLPLRVSCVESAMDDVAVMVERPAGLAFARRALVIGAQTVRTTDPVMEPGTTDCTLALVTPYAVAVLPWAPGGAVSVQSIRTGVELASAAPPLWPSVSGAVRGGVAFWSPVGSSGLAVEIARITERS